MSDTQSKAAPDQFATNPLEGRIGAMLRESYQEVVEEGIPDDFLALLQKADTNAETSA